MNQSICSTCETIVRMNNGVCTECEYIDGNRKKIATFKDLREELQKDLRNILPHHQDCNLTYMYTYNSLQYVTRVIEGSRRFIVEEYRTRALVHLEKYTKINGTTYKLECLRKVLSGNQ